MGWSSPNEEAIADRYHDERKNDFPLRLERQIPTALDVASLVKGVSIETGAGLIEQYAQTVAAGARLEQTEITADRIIKSIEAPLARKEPSHDAS